MVCAAVLALGVIYATLPGIADARGGSRRSPRAATAPRFIVRSTKVARAVIAVEDEGFYAHGAIDPVAIGRAVLTTLSAGSVDPGGSTLTQQLAKVLYVDDPATLLGRLRAIGLAFKLERRYTKPEILDMSSNAVYFGHHFYGIAAASRGYSECSTSLGLGSTRRALIPHADQTAGSCVLEPTR